MEFINLIPRLPGFRIRAVVLPAAGPRLSTIAQAVVADLPAGPWHVLGASFGGLVAWALPADRIRSLTTIGTLSSPTPRARRMRWAAVVLRRMPERLYREAYAPRARRSLEEDGADSALLDTLSIPPRDLFADRLAAIAAWGLPPRPPAPSTWIWGATDRFIQWTVADVAAVGIAAIVVPGGHRPHLSHPTEVARWLPRP